MKHIIILLICFSYKAYTQEDSLKYRKPQQLKNESLDFKNTDTVNFNTVNKKNSVFDPQKRSDKKKVLPMELPNAKQDSSSKIPKKKIIHQRDTCVNKSSLIKDLKNFIPSGSISFGYDYGFLPYTTNMPSPSTAVKTEGRISLNVFNIPLDVTYFYSSQKNLIGLNNYFRISYNADGYKDQLNNKLSGNADAYKNQLGQLTGQKQQVMQKMAYTDYLASVNPDKWPIDTTGSALGLNKEKKIAGFPNLDTTGITSQLLKADSSKYTSKYQSKADSINAMIQKYVYYKHKTDSVKGLYNDYSKQYDQLNDSIKRTQKKIDQIQDLTNGNNSSYLKNISYFNKAQNFLSGVKKFEIGLCYPNYSTFLTNNVPVRGINMEYGKNNTYFAFTYGTTVSTLLYNNKNIEGVLQNVRNSYNYFDFNNVAAGRKIISAKFGLGTKEGDHFFVGILIGKGQAVYLNPLPESPGIKSKESNVVVEADAKYKLRKNTILDVALGKSYLKEEDLSYDVIRTSLKEVFSNYRSYALLTKLSTKIDATKTNLTFTFRWVDPFFKSFGIGFIRSDNMRYEVKVDQPLTNKIKYTGMLRYEEDNLLNLMNFKNRFYSINNTVSYKIKRGLMLRLSYTPLFRTLSSETYSIKNRNSITTSVVTFTPKTRKTSVQFNFLYNYYLVNTDTQSINFQNVAYYHQITFKSGFKTGFNLSWFKNTLHDSLNNNVFLAVLDFGYQFKNGSSVTIAGKSAYKLNEKLYPGFIIKTNLKLYKKLFWENQIEKFIVGDLFNGYDYQNLKNFPYYCSTRLIYNF